MNNIPQKDAAVARRLKQAGAVLMGKANMNKFAGGDSGDNPDFGRIKTSPKPDGIICNVCQQINNVDVVSRDQQTIRLKCRVCSSEHGFYSEYAQKFGC